MSLTTKSNSFACFHKEICARYLQKHPIRLGGPGIFVQIDESCCSDKKGYTHKTANHSISFVERETGIHTKNVESNFLNLGYF
ncbi:uncharacterized protein LOC134839711 [Symsagittifera roscoffensis]|uniref:uncharacterized protein LOC134839711 n=1 Tax=Symsagittifera roscoffensis TaxID=84072 RepID=UPI00307CA94D